MPRLIWKGVFALFLILLATGCDSVTPDPPTVTYVVTGTVSQLAVTYTTEKGTQTEVQVAPPWTKKIEGTWGGTVTLIVQEFEGSEGSGQAEIRIDGEECNVRSTGISGGIEIRCRPTRDS
jgi:hypothetical protein